MQKEKQEQYKILWKLFTQHTVTDEMHTAHFLTGCLSVAKHLEVTF